MAGDWIKMRVDLPDDPAVIGIAAETGLDEYAVIGRLHKLWSWADQQLRNGDAKRVTAAWLDKHIGHQGFAKALESVGWLKVLSTGLSFPNFDRHNGKPAKDRALTRDRMKRLRDDKPVTNTAPEKRREDLINTSTVTIGTGAEKDPTDVGLPPQRQPRATPRTARPVDRTKAIIEEQRKAAEKATPPPGGSAMDLLKRATTNGNGADHTEPPIRQPGEDLEELNDIDLEAQTLGMVRLRFEDDDTLRNRIEARKALG